MALYEDIKGASQLWSQSTLLTKCVLALSSFLALSSVASLSDAVFKWKGFILDGIMLYNGTIPYFFTWAASKIGISISQHWATYYVIFGLVIFGMFRIYWLRSKLKAVLIIAFVTIFPLGSMYIRGNIIEVQTIWPFMIFIGFIYLRMPYFVSLTKNEKWSYYLPGIVAGIGILLLAAINSGLTREV